MASRSLANWGRACFNRLMRFSDMRGSAEAQATDRFFRALGAGDAAALGDLLDEAAAMENMDGPVPVTGLALARHLAGRADNVVYRLDEVEAEPGAALARFTLLVRGVPGEIRLEAAIRFAGARIASIVVRQPGRM